MTTETNERIERLQERYNSAYEVMLAFMGWDPTDAIRGCGLFQNALIDLLERSDPDEWTDERLEEYGLVRLPRNRDGEVINIGDKVYDKCGKAWKVGALHLYSSGSVLVSCVTDDANNYRKLSPYDLTHYPPVTVESVLREFYAKSNKALREKDVKKAEDVLDEYAKRLRLADE